MPLCHYIDHARRLVYVRLTGRVTVAEVFAYERDVMSRPDVSGYDELVDTTAVEEFPGLSAGEMRVLAARAARNDAAPEAPGRIAVLAPQDYYFGLGRMYQAFRELAPGSAKELGVFRTAERAREFLGLPEEYPFEEPGPDAPN